MARNDTDYRIVPSVLDRLLDYEPELSTEVAVSQVKSLRLLKQAQLNVEPEPEPVTFDTVLQLHSGEYKVQGG